MKHNLCAHVEALSDEEIATVHDRMFQHLAAHSKLWAGRAVPVAPKIRGGNLTACCELEGFLPGGMTGHIIYNYRKDPNVHVLSGDDYITIDFEPDARLYRDIVDDFIPALIQAMKPFVLTMGDDQFDAPLWSPEGKCQLGGPRACGCELHPVFFFSDWWLQEGYKLTRDQARQALEPIADQVTPIEDGLYVVGLKELTSFETALDRALRMEKSLKLAKPGLKKFFRELFRRGRAWDGVAL